MKRSVYLIMAVLFGSSVACTQSVVQVTNLFDSGAGSFRNAVAIAFPLDTIRFQVTGTITVLNTSITYDKDLIIEGPGMDLLTLNGNDLKAPLRITGGSTWISGLTISQGRETTGNMNSGAGLGFEGDTLVMDHVRVTQCAFSGSGGNSRYGAGLGVTALRVRISDCQFTNNYILDQPSDNGIAYGGGASIICPDFRMTGSVIKHNTSRGRGNSGASLAYGGGLYLAGAGVIESCMVDSNTVVSEGYWQGNGGVDAHGYGGGVYISDQSQVVMRSTSVSNNTITLIPNEDPYYFGGGLFVQRAHVHLEECAVNNNYIAPDQLTLFQSLGGGVYVRDGALTLRGTTLDGNIGDRGSGICFDEANNTYPLHKLVLDRTRVLNGSGRQDGAAVYVWPADAAHLRDVEIRGNSHRGLLVRQTDTLHVDRALIMENGGGAHVYEQPTNENHFINCTFHSNGAAQGAGVLVEANTLLSFINCTFMQDTLTNGGTDGREVQLNNSTAYFKNTILSSVVFQPAAAYGAANGAVISGGGNVSRDASFAGSFTLPNDLNSTNPQMGTFDDHGGFTRTWSLAANSTCIDQGGPDTLSVDGRGYLRDGLVDAGAFESGGTDPLVITLNAVSNDDTVCVGEPLTVSIDATSGSIIGYQWSLNGQPIGGATASTYTVAAALTDAGAYTCTLTTAGDTVVVGPIMVEVDICTSVTLIDRSEFRMYPQPATDRLHGRAAVPIALAKILTMEGRLLHTTQPNSMDLVLDLSGLPAGPYILEVHLANSSDLRTIFTKQ